MKTEMKSGRQPPAVFQQSRRLRRPRSGDTERVRALLNRLQTIVPAAPKDRQLPQVQVIQHVINYICQLQHQVVKHPRLRKMVSAGDKCDGAAGRLTAQDESKLDGEVDSKPGKEVENEAVMEVDREAVSEAVEAVQIPSDRHSPSPTDSDGSSPV